MFSSLSKIFRAKNKVKKPITNDSFIKFQDSKLQSIRIAIQTYGQEVYCSIFNTENNSEICLDREQASLVAVILNEYSKKGNIQDIVNLIKEENPNA